MAALISNEGQTGKCLDSRENILQVSSAYGMNVLRLCSGSRDLFP